MRRAALVCIAATFSASLALAATAIPTPTETVRVAVEQVIVLLRDKTLKGDERWERITPIIDKSFDFQSMSQSVLATRWQSASAEEKRQFVEFFSQYLEDTYRRKIELYTDQQVRYVDERIDGNRAEVETVIVTDSTEIPVLYKMRLKEEKWYAYDLVIEGVSLVNNYRNTFAAIAQTSGVRGVLMSLQSRLAQERAQGSGSGAPP